MQFYNPHDAQKSMSVGDCMQWMLSSFKTVEEVLQKMDEILVVGVNNKDFGEADLPFHFKNSRFQWKQ
jgi:choloylglycine hydrolase